MAAVSKYPAELKERAVAMARELERELGPGRGAIAQVAAQLGIHPEALRYWVRRDEGGYPSAGPAQPAPVTAQDERIAELERENRELRRANEILKLASAFSRSSGDHTQPVLDTDRVTSSASGRTSNRRNYSSRATSCRNARRHLRMFDHRRRSEQRRSTNIRLALGDLESS